MPITLEDINNSLSVAQVAEIVHRDPQTIRRWIKRGDLEAIRPGGGSRTEFRITKRALTEFLNRRGAVA